MVINLNEEPCAAMPKARIRTHGEAKLVCGGRSVMGVPTASDWSAPEIVYLNKVNS